MIKVLFLCTGNSCRSIIAESILSDMGKDRITSYSAGSHPTGEVHQKSLWVLEKNGNNIKNLKSKNLDSFHNEHLDIVITVCDNAASEPCPIFLGNSLKSHWGIPDPASFEGTEEEIEQVFLKVYDTFKLRVQEFLKLPLENLLKENKQLLQKKLNEIGELGI